MSDVRALQEAQLEAGGYLSKKPESDPPTCEQVVARVYSGGPLGDRVVVRLTSDHGGVAEDLLAQYFMVEQEDSRLVGAWRRRTTPGFLESALARCPENAKDILEVAQAMQAATKHAALKPGSTWKVLDELATQFDQGMIQLSPFFWEEVAWVYDDLGNSTYAARAVGRSLEAEQTHALQLDPIRRQGSMVEFALRGHLTGKALSTYAKGLAESREPAEAFRIFADLFRRRTLGGGVPTVEIAKDLLRMATAGGRDVAAEVENLLSDILSSPEAARASIRFWREIAAPIKRMLARDRSVGLRLLQQTNSVYRRDADEFLPQWLKLLKQWKVTDLLFDQGDIDESILRGGRAGWIAGLALSWSPLGAIGFDIIEQMAAALQADGRPVPLMATAVELETAVDVDLLEVLLTLGIDVDSPTDDKQVDFSLESWLFAESDHPRRGSSLTHIASDERFHAAFHMALENMMETIEGIPSVQRGSEMLPLAEIVASSDVILKWWGERLDHDVEYLDSRPAADAEDAVGKLTAACRQGAFDHFPHVVSRLTVVDWPAILQRTLRLGVLDEYGWPALDEAHAKVPLPAKSRNDLPSPSWVFPFVAYVHGSRLVVVSPGDADLSREVPPDVTRISTLLPVRTDLLLFAYIGNDYQGFAFWFSQPDERVSWDAPYLGNAMLVPWREGVFLGSNVVCPGDRVVSQCRRFLHDGKRFWVVTSNELSDGVHLRWSVTEVDPLTEETLSLSLPDWFHEGIPDGGEIDWDNSYLLPLPNDTIASPVGSREGLIGWRVISLADGTVLGQGIDGRAVQAHPSRHPRSWRSAPVAMIDQPCGDGAWAIRDDLTVFDAKSGHGFARLQRPAKGNAVGYASHPTADCPPLYYHLMKLRDEATSRRLRNLSRDEAHQLLNAANRDRDLFSTACDSLDLWQQAQQNAMRTLQSLLGGDEPDADEPDEPSAALATVCQLFPHAPDTLQHGIAAVANFVASLQARIDEAVDAHTGKDEPSAADEAEAQTNAHIDDGMRLLTETSYNKAQCPYFDSVGIAGRAPEIASVLRGDLPEPPKQVNLTWLYLAADLPAAAWWGYWKAIVTGDSSTPPPDRLDGELLPALGWIKDSGLFDLNGTVRVYLARPQDEKRRLLDQLSDDDQLSMWRQESTIYLAELSFITKTWEDVAVVVAHAANGEPLPPDGYDVLQYRDLSSTWQSNQIGRFIDAASRANQLPLPSPSQLEQAAVRLGITPCEVAIGWMGNVRTGEIRGEQLSGEIRAHFGWKVKDVKAAAAMLDGDTTPPAVFAAPVRSNPALPFGAELPQALEALVKEWKAHTANSLRLPPELSSLVEERFIDSREFQVLCDRQQRTNLWQPSTFRFVEDSDVWCELGVKFEHETAIEASTLLAKLPTVIKVANYRLPFGHPVRRELSDWIGEIQAYLADPHSVVVLKDCNTDLLRGFDPDKVPPELLRALGSPQQDRGMSKYDDGTLIAGWKLPALALLFRPAAMDEETANRLAALLSSIQRHPTRTQIRLPQIDGLNELRSQTMTRLAEHNRSTAIPEGRWDQDPRAGSAKLVAEVASSRKISEEAAAYYLALLALPDPTDANIRTWFNWNTQQLKSCAKELADINAVVQAKRSRAGRSVFLPGGWLPLKRPHLPLERWKLSLLGMSKAETDSSSNRPPIVPPCPVDDLFAKAWQRVRAGDDSR